MERLFFPLFGIMLGAVVGSFLATAAIRLPQGASILGRSRCDACGAPVRALRLVPIVSYLVQGGRARCCGARIDPVHPMLELVAATLGAVALGLSPDAHGLAGAILGWALLLLVVLDIRHLWLPDAITLPLLALGLLAGPAPWQDRVLSAAIAGGGLLMVHGVYRAIRGRDGLGLGDVKLGAALGAWLSPVLLPPLLLLAAGLGLLLVVVATVGRGRAPRAVPFGACLAVAGWLLWAVATSV